MSLTVADLQLTRNAVSEVVDEKVPLMFSDAVHQLVPSIVDDRLTVRLAPLEGEVKALRNDVKELYDMMPSGV